MNANPGAKKFVLITTAAIILSYLFLFLGAPFLRVLRNIYGAKKYWFTGLVVVAALFALPVFNTMAFMLAACWVVVGIYSELEVRGHAGFWAGIFSTVVATATAIGGLFFTSKVFGINLSEEIQKNIDQLLAQVQANSSAGQENLSLISGIKIDAAFVMSQIPSVAFVMFFTTLAYGLMMEQRTAMFLNVRFERIASELKLISFKLPDWFVWLGMFSFLGSFLKLNNEVLSAISMSVFIIMMGLYFFQGLAILEHAMRVFRVGVFIRIFLYFTVVFQLFFILSAVGFIDYWVNFRKRLDNLKLKMKKQNNGEQI